VTWRWAIEFVSAKHEHFSPLQQQAILFIAILLAEKIGLSEVITAALKVCPARLSRGIRPAASLQRVGERLTGRIATSCAGRFDGFAHVGD
jgi:hypothetical protein